ncbi:MAG: addiction module protein [Coriobacteriia bacterium]|nr:addiction module protein [Coriobacteriia bacterium]
MTIDELKAEALQLAPEGRADLARELLASLDSLSESEIERLWLDEAERRLAQLESGEATADPSDVVLARVRARRG